MKKLIVILLCCYTALSANAQRFDSDVKALAESISKTVEIDSRKFDSCMTVVEARIAKYDKKPVNVHNSTELSVLHAMAGLMYRSLSNRRSDYRNADIDYSAKSKEHWNKVLDNKTELARANGKDYKALVTFGADGELFNHDMLIVMANLYMDNMSVPYYRRRSTIDSLRNELKFVYESLGRLKAVEVLNDLCTYEHVRAAEPRYDKDSVILYWRDMQKKYAKSRFVNHYINQEKSALCPYVEFAIPGYNKGQIWIPGERVCIADHPFNVILKYYNCKSANLTIREYVGDEKGKKSWETKPKETGKVVKTLDFTFGNDDANKIREKLGLPVKGTDSTSVTLPAGQYVFVYKSIGEKKIFKVDLSSLKLLSVKDGNRLRCYVLDAYTGKPVEGAKVMFKYKDEHKSEKQEAISNKDGEVIFDSIRIDQDYKMTASLGDNDRISLSGRNYSWLYTVKNDEELITQIRLDRAIYRPGQKVNGYVVAYRQVAKDKYEVVKGEKISVKCKHYYDRNSLVYDDSLVTNEFGSVDFSFTLPSDAKVGVYQTICEDDYLEFKVEEYKSPTWELSLASQTREGNNTAISFGDTVMVKGLAISYSGVPVQGAKVEYTLERAYQNYSFYRMDYECPETIGKGVLSVNDDGSFLIPMLLVKGDNDCPCVYFIVKAKVTDVAGETHEEEYSLRMLKNEFALDIKGKQNVDLNNESEFIVKAVDALNNEVAVDVTCTLFLRGKEEATKVFPSNKPFRISDFYGGPSLEVPVGSFSLEAKATDSKGHKIETLYQEIIKVFDTNLKTVEKRRANYYEGFVYTPCDTIKDGKTSYVYFCPEYDDVDVFLFQGTDKIKYCDHSTYQKKMYVLPVRPLEKDEDSNTFALCYVKHGKTFSRKVTFYRALPEENLVLSWSTFRNHLQPGQKETWKISVRTESGKSLENAEMLATMYDMSLDAFNKNEWERFSLFRRGGHSLDVDFSGFKITNPLLQSSFNRLTVGSYKYDTFNTNVFLVFPSYLLKNVKVSANKRLRGVSMAASPNVDMVDMTGLAFSTAEEALEGNISGLDIEEPGTMKYCTVRAASPDTDPLANVKVTPRTNFAETAFFYPHLVTDKNGEVEISFTLPESLTKWKFLGFAHDKNMRNGVITAQAIAQKQFMVQPQMPRFIRVGDEATIATRVINQSDKALTGNAVMRLLNAKDESLISSQTVAFSVEAGKTTTVSFPLTATSSSDDIICEIVAEGSDGSKIQEVKSSKKSKGKVSQLSTLNSQLFSDGERNLIPVLPSRLVITESVPFYIKNGETKNVNLSGLYNGNSKTADEKTMSIEYTANPVWTVVEALHDIETPESPCATSLAASVYANTRLLNIASQMKAFTDKQIVNTDSVSAKLSKSWNDLKALQCSDGGFRWFPGFERSSYYITLSVAEQLVKVANVQVNNDGDKDSSLFTLHSSLSYLDSIQVCRYEYNKAHNIKTTPSESDLHYLYVCSQCPDRKVSVKAKKIREEYLSYLEKNIKELSIYGMSSSSNILRAFGHKSSADKFVNTVRNYLVYDEGQGKHFESKRAQYCWRDYRIPTQVAAMNAIYAANPDDEALNDMTLWLLRQKQVQSWDSPTNTVDVADLLLKLNQFGSTTNPDGNSSLFTLHSSLPQMKLNNSFLSSNSFVKDNVKADSLFFAEEMGYMNKQVNPALIDNSANSISVISSPRGGKGGGLVSWGAVTVTFTEDSENLKSYSTGEIKISRRMMIEEDGKWVDIKEGTALRVGQKIRVRHTLSTDRDMDYVRVKTLHPACFEPTEVLSGYRWKGGTGCYQSIHDSYIEMFFERFREGTSTLDLDYFVTRPGTYNMGVTSAECTYAPSFGGHSSGMKVKVNE